MPTTATKPSGEPKDAALVQLSEELERVRARLLDAEEDVAILRSQLARASSGIGPSPSSYPSGAMQWKAAVTPDSRTDDLRWQLSCTYAVSRRSLLSMGREGLRKLIVEMSDRARNEIVEKLMQEFVSHTFGGNPYGGH